MLQFFRHITFIFCILCASSIFAVAPANVSVSAKESEDHIFLIFHHDRSTNLSPSFLGNNGRVRGDKAIILNSYQDSLVNKICDSLGMNKQYQNIIDLKLKDKYRFLKTIQGEKLVAFKISNPDYKATDDKTTTDDKQLEEVKASEAGMADDLKNAAKDARNQPKENHKTIVGTASQPTALPLHTTADIGNTPADIAGKDEAIMQKMKPHDNTSPLTDS